METVLSVCCHFRVSLFWISSINVPQKEMLLSTLIAYKWLHFYKNSLIGKGEKKKQTEKDLANQRLQGIGLV